MEVAEFIMKLFKVIFLILPELIVYLGAYYAVNAVYRSSDKEFNGENGILTRLVEYFHVNALNMARDLTFLLGFYVSTVAKRWWDQVSYLPEPDNLALFLNGVVIQDARQSVLYLKRKIVRCTQLFKFHVYSRNLHQSLHFFQIFIGDVDFMSRKVQQAFETSVSRYGRASTHWPFDGWRNDKT